MSGRALFRALAAAVLVVASVSADDHANDGAGATLLAPGAALGGVIEVGGDRDVFRLAAELGRSYTVETGQLTAGMDSVLVLYDPSGQPLAEDDDGAGNLASRLTFTAATTGNHYLLVRHYDRQNGTGGYRIAASASGGSSSESSSSAAPPVSASSELVLASRVFDPKLAGAELELSTRRAGSGSYSAQLEVLDAQGQTVRQVASASRSRGRTYRDRWDGRDRSGRFVAPGDYRVRFTGGGGAREQTLHVVRLGVRAVSFGGTGRVPLSYHRAESWSGSAFPVDNAGPAWTLSRSPLGAGCLDARDGSPLDLPAPWWEVDGPPRSSSGALLERGRSLPVAYRAGSVAQVTATLGDTAAHDGRAVGCNLPLSGRPLRLVVQGGAAASAMSGELRPGDRVTLDLPPLDGRLGKQVLRVRFGFAYREDDGSWRAIPGAQTSEHTLYSVLGAPLREDVPGGRPWVAALELASGWLGDDTRREDELLAKVTRGINAGLGLRYEDTQGAPAYTDGPDLLTNELDLTAFLANRRNGRRVNCLDCASLVTQFAAQLGARGKILIMGWDFRLNYLKGIGGASFTNGLFFGYHAFSYHAVATFDRGASIHDACLSVDDDSQPWRSPFVERLPLGMPESRYRQQLGADPFQGRALGQATPR